VSEIHQTEDAEVAAADDSAKATRPIKKQDWKTPMIEDVSEQVMAQPYIRFT
jgi:hypothetical protein